MAYQIVKLAIPALLIVATADLHHGLYSRVRYAR